jgi:hypothetical protein
VALYFTTQKNGVRSKAISHGASGHPTACPLRVSYLRSLQEAPPDTPLCAVLERNRWRLVLSTSITAALRASTTAIGDALGLKPFHISAQALRAGGAMSLLPSWKGGLRHHPTTHWPLVLGSDPTLPPRLSASNNAVPRSDHDREHRLPPLPDPCNRSRGLEPTTMRRPRPTLLQHFPLSPALGSQVLPLQQHRWRP